MSLAQLAEATGATVAALRRWQDLGLIGRTDRRAPVDIERVRLIQFATQRGLDAEAIARASESQGDLLGRYVELITAGRARIGRSLAAVGEETGLAPAVVQRLWAAANLGDQAVAYEEDVEALGWIRTALDAGLPEDALAQILRVFADALGRVAETEARLFHYYVHERLRASGLAGTELIDAAEAVSEPLGKLMEPAVLYFHRKAYQRALREDLLVHLADDDTPPSEVVGEMRATILFVDLSGFTPLTEAMGDAAAAGVVERFSDLVRRAAGACHGRVVKQIGDEFMLVFTEPSAAITCGLDIDAATRREAQFPALRLGAHTGNVLYREGDYVGATVNVAARVAGCAQRHEFLITGALHAHVVDVPDVEIRSIGANDLKGVPAAVDLFEVSRPAARPHRTIDPVCLMELDSGSDAVHLTRDGREVAFCSDDCLRLFVADPERYDTVD
jgi:adenylate cyclase